MAKFKVGDKIEYVPRSGINQRGEIVGYSSYSIYGSDEYIIMWDHDVVNPEHYACESVDHKWSRVGSNNPFTVSLPNPLADSKSWIFKGYMLNTEINFVPISLKYDANGLKTTIGECQHKFVPYYGLIDYFEYCTICDEKKRE